MIGDSPSLGRHALLITLTLSYKRGDKSYASLKGDSFFLRGGEKDK